TAFRRSFLDLLGEGGVAIGDRQRRKMLWREDLSPRALALGGRGYVRYAYGAKDDLDLNEALKLAPRSYIVLDNLAYARWKKEEAGKLFREALRRNRNGVDALEGLVLIAAHSNQLDVARKAVAAKARIRQTPKDSPESQIEL